MSSGVSGRDRTVSRTHLTRSKSRATLLNGPGCAGYRGVGAPSPRSCSRGNPSKVRWPVVGYGLVSDVWEPADLLPEARRIAQRIAANGPLAAAALKRLAQDTEGLPLSAAYDLTEHFFGMLKNSQDRIEGRRAFAEKRTPNFVGR